MWRAFLIGRRTLRAVVIGHVCRFVKSDPLIASRVPLPNARCFIFFIRDLVGAELMFVLLTANGRRLTGERLTSG